MGPVTKSRGWKKFALEEIVSIKHGYAFASEYFGSEGRYAVMTPGHFMESGGYRELKSKQKYYNAPFPKEYILHEGSLIVAMTEQAPGLLGSTLLVPKKNKYLHNQRLGLIEIRDKMTICIAFLFHLMNSQLIRKPISITASGTKVRHTSPSKIGEIEVVIPTLCEQKRISAILDASDCFTNRTERLIAAKQERRIWLLQQFMTGKLRIPGFVDSWSTVTVGDIAEEVSIRNQGQLGAEAVRAVNKAQGMIPMRSHVMADNLSRYKVVEKNWFAYNPMRINIGSICQLTGEEKALVSPDYVVFKCREDRVDHRYFNYFRQAHAWKAFLEAAGNGSVRVRIYFNDLGRLAVPLPSLAEQRKIADCLDIVDRELELLNSQLDALREQKKGLMQQLLTGKIRVRCD